jgi:predicted enzyme related to lactoylglutathione lyase
MELTEIATFTEDVQATASFYEHLFGPPAFADDGIAVFDVDGVEVMVHETYDAGDGDLPPEDHYAFAVDDVDEAFADAVDAGLETYREPADHDWGRSAYLRDPDGRLVELAEA